jgi:leucyl-tRNA synthetase
LGDERAFEPRETIRAPKFYALEMLPYPSGFLHMGHVRNYSIGDALAWYKRLRGFNCAASDWLGQLWAASLSRLRSSAGVQPRDWTEENIAPHGRPDAGGLGISYDWSRVIAGAPSGLLQVGPVVLFEDAGAAAWRTSARSAVNWCPKEETVLSNEQSSGGICWRCGTQVTKERDRAVVSAHSRSTPSS